MVSVSQEGRIDRDPVGVFPGLGPGLGLGLGLGPGTRLWLARPVLISTGAFAGLWLLLWMVAGTLLISGHPCRCRQ